MKTKKKLIIKDCPNCGGPAKIRTEYEHDYGWDPEVWYRVECNNTANCGLQTAEWAQVKTVLKQWNRRVK